MIFTGCKQFKTLESIIELNYEGKNWDLHNVGEFQSFTYKCLERIVAFDWKYFSEEGKPLSNLCRLEFIDVSSFDVKARDVVMPYSEDDCLSGIFFDNLKNSFTLKFMGGLKINIFCNEIQFSLVPN